MGLGCPVLQVSTARGWRLTKSLALLPLGTIALLQVRLQRELYALLAFTAKVPRQHQCNAHVKAVGTVLRVHQVKLEPNVPSVIGVRVVEQIRRHVLLCRALFVMLAPRKVVGECVQVPSFVQVALKTKRHVMRALATFAQTAHVKK